MEKQKDIVIPILSKTIKTNHLPDIAGFIKEMRKLGVEVKVSGNVVVDKEVRGDKRRV